MYNIYSITDLEGFCLHVRDNAAKTLCDNNKEDLEEYITTQQVKNLVQSFSLGTDDNNDLMIDESSYEQILDAIIDDIYQAGLSKLAASDKINCAWDDAENCMIFWAKET